MAQRVTRQWQGRALRAALLGPILFVAAALAPDSALVRPADAAAVVVKPEEGRHYRTGPVTAAVHARDGALRLRARLNGHNVARHFGFRKNGVRKARLSLSHGLRHGKNVLRVAARDRIGRWRRDTVRFTLRRRLPLTGAGHDMEIVAGSRTTLRGAVHPGRGARKKDVRYRWKLVKAPKKSRYSPRRGDAAASTPIDDPTSQTTSFDPDALGSYTVKLSSEHDSRSSADTVTVDALPPAPQVPIDTMARDASNNPMIKVGDVSYPATTGPADRQSWLQVVALDRKTLAPVPGQGNTTYQCDQSFAGATCSIDQIRADLAKLDSKSLVIVSNHGLPTWRSPGLVELQQIGVKSFQSTGVGTFSAIGVPGLPAGEADAKIVSGRQPGSGRMAGYLTRNQHELFTWLPSERPTFDTRAATDCPDPNVACQNTIAVGDQRRASNHGGTPGGYQVEVFDGHTLDFVGSGFFNTGAGPTTAEAQRMHDFISGTAAGNLVAITAMQHPTSRLEAPIQNADPGVVSRLAEAVASVGGTRDLFLRSGTLTGGNAGTNYSMIGWAGAGEGAGEETSSRKTGSRGQGRIQGLLVRDHDQLYKPTGATVDAGPPVDTLNRLLLQPATTPWPYANDKNVMAAMLWLAGHDQRIKDDPRAAYWTQDLTGADWTAIQNEIRAVDCRSNSDFTFQNCLDARNQLVKELGWVAATRSYLAALSTPLTAQNFTNWLNLTVITDRVKEALKPPDQSTLMAGREIIGFLVAMGAAVPGSEVVELFALSFDFELNFLVEKPDGSDSDSIQAEANQLGLQMSLHLAEAAKGFTSMGDVLVSDYAKLQTVGTNAQCNPASPTCPPEWQLTGPQKDQATANVWKATESAFTQEFMSIAFPAYYLSPRTNQEDPRQHYGCGAFFLTVFQDEIYDGFVGLLHELPFGFNVYALANVSNITLTNRIPNTPPGSVTHRMFNPLSTSTNPNDGGLGIYAPDYFLEANKGVGPFDRPSRKAEGYPDNGYPDGCGWK